MIGRKRKYRQMSSALSFLRPRRDWWRSGLTGLSGGMGIRSALRGGFGMTGTGSRNRTTSGRGITNEYDRKLIYKRRRMPRRRKKLWKKFVSRVHAASEKDLGSRTILRNERFDEAYSYTGASTGSQGLVNVALYPCRSAATKTYLDDLNQIFINELASVPVIGSTGKLVFKSAILDMTVCNTSALDITDPQNPAPASLEVDVYEIGAGRRFDKNAYIPANADLLNIFGEANIDTPPVSVGNQQIALSTRGATPWDLPSALSEYRIKIYKKTKFFLSAGQTFTYQMRDPKRHVIDLQRINSSNPTANLPGLTRWLLLIFKPTPCTRTDSDTNPDIIRLSVGVTRKYLYKVVQQNEDRDARL